MTKERSVQLLRELSLDDLCKLLLAKATVTGQRCRIHIRPPAKEQRLQVGNIRLTRPQQVLLRWLCLAREYSRWVEGPELRTARALERLGLATCEWRDDAWFATVTPKGRGGIA